MHRIETVEEGQSRGQVRDIYRDIEHSLAVPFVGAIFRALAAVPDALPSTWAEVKPNLETQAFSYLSRRIRRQSETLAESTFEFVDLYSWMLDHGCEREDIRRILYSLEMLHFVNSKLLLITASLYAALNGVQDERIISRKATPLTTQESEYPTAIHRVSYEQAPEIAKETYLDIVEALRAPFVPDDFQILGNWPQFLHKCWTEIKPTMHSQTYQEEARSVSSLAVGLSLELPFQVHLDVVGQEVRTLTEMFLRICSHTCISTAAIRWMLMEGQRSARNTGRAAGEQEE